MTSTPGGSPAPARPREPWQCPECGLNNPSSFDICGDCEAERPSERAADILRRYAKASATVKHITIPASPDNPASILIQCASRAGADELSDSLNDVLGIASAHASAGQRIEGPSASGCTPTPWRVEEDWTAEIYGADGSLIGKFVYPQKIADAHMVVRMVNERAAPSPTVAAALEDTEIARLVKLRADLIAPVVLSDDCIGHECRLCHARGEYIPSRLPHKEGCPMIGVWP